MSKLSKFKDGLTPTEAATLLSRLIDEDVTETDIREIFFSGWLDIYTDCNATLVRTEPLLEKELHEDQLNLGHFMMTAKEDIGFCWAIHLPCQDIDIDGKSSVMALWDDRDNLYALRDNETNEYLTADLFEPNFFDKIKIEPSDIYKLAESANKDEPASIALVKSKRNRWCPLNEELYNFRPGDHRPAKQPTVANKQYQQETPAFALVVAVLAEITINRDAKKRNQSSLIDEILDNYKFRGLSKSNLEKMLSQANRQLAETRAAKD